MENPTPAQRDSQRDSRPSVETDIDRITQQRSALKSRHSQALSKLMEDRADLRGVHALADFVDDSLRWAV